METIKNYHKNSNVIAYKKTINDKGYWIERTYDKKGNQLTYKDSNKNWNERTYDKKGNELTFKDSNSNYEIKGRKVTKEEFEAFTNLLLSKIDG